MIAKRFCLLLIAGLTACSDTSITAPPDTPTARPAADWISSGAIYHFARVQHRKGWALASALPGGFSCEASGGGQATYTLTTTQKLLDDVRTALAIGRSVSIDLMTMQGFHYGGFSRIDETVTISLNGKTLSTETVTNGYNNPGNPGIWHYPIHGHALSNEDIAGFTAGTAFQVDVTWRATASIPKLYCGNRVYGALAQASVITAPQLQIAP